MPKKINLKNSYIYKYKEQIDSGKIVVGKKIKALLNKIDRIINQPNPDVYLDLKAGHKVINFVENFCHHVQGRWKEPKIKLELWQKAMIESTYGLLKTKTNFRGINNRAVNKLFLVIGRKNGKSILAAALSHYHLLADNEEGAKVLTAATTRDQAKIVFDAAKQMISKSPALSQELKFVKNAISSPRNNGEMFAVSADAKNLDGHNPSCVIIDEIHAHKTGDVVRVLTSADGARDQAMYLMLTTSGFIRNSIYDDYYELSSQSLLENNNSFELLPWIFELDNREEIHNSKNWIKANPNLGVSIAFDKFESQYNSACANENEMNNFLTKHCNIPLAGTQEYISYDSIMKNNGTFDLEDFRDGYCFIGLDMSRTLDLTGLSFIFVKPNDPKLYVHSLGFMPETTLKEKIMSDKVPYETWIEQGWIKTLEGSHISSEKMVKFINDFIQEYDLNVWGIGYDRFGATDCINRLENAGYPLFKVAQGATTLHHPMSFIKGKFLNQEVVYNENKAFVWNAGNVVVELDAGGNMKPSKKSIHTQRIDMFASLLDALVPYLDKIEELRTIIDDEKENNIGDD